MKRIVSGLGRISLTLAAMTFIAAVSLFAFGTFLTTWPILRLSPRDRKIRASIDLASAGMTLAQVLRKPPGDGGEATPL